MNRHWITGKIVIGRRNYRLDFWSGLEYFLLLKEDIQLINSTGCSSKSVLCESTGSPRCTCKKDRNNGMLLWFLKKIITLPACTWFVCVKASVFEDWLDVISWSQRSHWFHWCSHCSWRVHEAYLWQVPRREWIWYVTTLETLCTFKYF